MNHPRVAVKTNGQKPGSGDDSFDESDYVTIDSISSDPPSLFAPSTPLPSFSSPEKMKASRKESMSCIGSKDTQSFSHEEKHVKDKRASPRSPGGKRTFSDAFGSVLKKASSRHPLQAEKKKPKWEYKCPSKDTTETPSNGEETEIKRRDHQEMVRGLFGRLDYLVAGGIGETDRKRIPNTKILKSAVTCIRKLEKSLVIQNRIYEALFSGNRRLKEIIAGMMKSKTEYRPVRSSLFHCEKCNPATDLEDPRNYFLHQTVCHGGDDEHQREDLSAQSEEAHTQPSFHCNQCQANLPNFNTYQIHSFLHQDLVLFHCSVERCGQLFGAPSKVSRHYLKEHGTVLHSERHLVLTFNARVRLTRQIQQLLAGLEFPRFEDIAQIDNFLEAHLDAKLIYDELEINRKIGNLTDGEFISECKEKIRPKKA